MRVLVACEFSGIVRDAFAARGHDAWSCDWLPTERPSKHHIESDVVCTLRWEEPWDLIIAHPPCRYLAVSGARWFKGREQEQESALHFARFLIEYPYCERVCVENPIGILSTRVRKPDQVVQPWYFGDDASKATCLWLKNLPPLQPRNPLSGDRRTRRANQTPSGQNKLGPSPTRAADRARTYPGIAAAMAEQWGQVA